MQLSHKKVKLLIEPHYLPSILFIQQCLTYQQIEFEQVANYQRSSYFNRAYIAGANGKQRLTIPLQGGNRQKIMLKNIEMDNSVKWQRIHWQALQSAYAKSAYFEYYEPELKQLFTQKTTNLLQWNISFLKFIFSCLNFNINYSFTDSYKDKFQVKNEVLDLRNKIRPNMSLQQFEFQKYYQLFQEKNGFINNMSVLDVLFSTGPNTVAIIKSTKFSS